MKRLVRLQLYAQRAGGFRQSPSLCAPTSPAYQTEPRTQERSQTPHQHPENHVCPANSTRNSLTQTCICLISILISTITCFTSKIRSFRIQGTLQTSPARNKCQRSSRGTLHQDPAEITFLTFLFGPERDQTQRRGISLIQSQLRAQTELRRVKKKKNTSESKAEGLDANWSKCVPVLTRDGEEMFLLGFKE